ncbi:MAG TPA: XrtA/PEP-CTERM system histidine kinase PrsK, partial [Stellaceae bacterium]|nr:XrtA/PEP-CTERM system histidine kinase PrsK [Stellaceae bacterium]
MTVPVFEAGLFGYAAAAIAYLVVTALAIAWWKRDLGGFLLAIASLATAGWAAIGGFELWRGFANGEAAQLAEVIRNGAWTLLALSLFYWVSPGRRLRWAAIFVGLCIAVAGLTLLIPVIPSLEESDAPRQIFFVGHLGLALIGLALIENLFRNAPRTSGWTIKHLCFGMGSIFAFDFFVYADAFLFHRLDLGLFLARGILALAVAPLFVVYAKRTLNAGPQIAVSRAFAFYSTTFIVAGLYLLGMTAAGYYVRRYGGTWGTFLQALFFFGAILLLIVPIASGSVRSYVRVLLEKHLFAARYDYRREWLRLIRTISDRQNGEELKTRVIHAICDILDSPDGGLFLPGDRGRFSLAASWNFSRWDLAPDTAIPADSPLVRFLESSGWVVDLSEYARAPEHYSGLSDLPPWLCGNARAWLVIPLLLDDRLFAILVLGRARAERRLTWEDFDLLKTVARQAASYLAQQKSDEALAEARQFDAFNKRFAFVAHDIKNLVSQLSLLLANSEKHRGDPQFQIAMIDTVRRSIDKLNAMLRQLRTEPPQQRAIGPVVLGQLLRELLGD